MKRIPILCAVVFGLFGCDVGESTDSTSQFVSCYDTGHGVKCVNTSKPEATADVDVNGTIDHLVCANGDSDGSDPTSQSSDSGPSASDDGASQSGTLGPV